MYVYILYTKRIFQYGERAILTYGSDFGKGKSACAVQLGSRPGKMTSRHKFWQFPCAVFVPPTGWCSWSNWKHIRNRDKWDGKLYPACYLFVFTMSWCSSSSSSSSVSSSAHTRFRQQTNISGVENVSPLKQFSNAYNLWRSPRFLLELFYISAAFCCLS